MLIRCRRPDLIRRPFTQFMAFLDMVQGMETFWWMVLTQGRPGKVPGENVVLLQGCLRWRTRIGISSPCAQSKSWCLELERRLREHGLLQSESAQDFHQHQKTQIFWRGNILYWEHGVRKDQSGISRLPHYENGLTDFLDRMISPEYRCILGCDPCPLIASSPSHSPTG